MVQSKVQELLNQKNRAILFFGQILSGAPTNASMNTAKLCSTGLLLALILKHASFPSSEMTLQLFQPIIGDNCCDVAFFMFVN